MSKREFPARIYLQRNNDDRMGGPEVIEDTTWCADKINDEDVEYVRLDLHKAALARKSSAPSTGGGIAALPSREGECPPTVGADLCPGCRDGYPVAQVGNKAFHITGHGSYKCSAVLRGEGR